MPARWCECKKCDGGKVVSKTTWYRHQKRLRASRYTPCRISTQRPDPSLSSVPGPSTGINLNESGEGGPPDNVGRLVRSENVSAYINLINLLILYRTMKTWRTFRDVGLLCRCPNLITFLVLCPPHLVYRPLLPIRPLPSNVEPLDPSSTETQLNIWIFEKP